MNCFAILSAAVETFRKQRRNSDGQSVISQSAPAEQIKPPDIQQSYSSYSVLRSHNNIL